MILKMKQKPFNQIANTCGFFTYGEFYSDVKKELLNQTMTILALSESDNIPKNIEQNNRDKQLNNNDTLKALSHLINTTTHELKNVNTKQTNIYNNLRNIGKNLNETLQVDEVYAIAMNFIKNELNFEKCLIFQHDDKNGWFNVVKSLGYNNAVEKRIIKIINLLLSGEVIDYLRTSGDPIIHTAHYPNKKVEKLTKSLFLDECYFELIGGTINIPFGLIVVGNSKKSLLEHARIKLDSISMLGLENLTVQISNTINNIVFYKAWSDEKEDLEDNIIKRTKELNEQKNTFEAIYKTSKDGIAILDVQSTSFLDINQAFMDMTGFTKEELLKTSCLKLSLEKDLQRSKEAMKQVIKNGFITNFIKDCKTKDGGIVNINMSVALMNDDKRVLISAKDRTKQQELEADLIKQKRKAEDSTKIKSEFLANMSHEIRTPMNGILGMSHLVLQTNLNEKQKNYIQKIDSSGKLLLNIINDILDFSKIEAGKFIIEKVDFDMFEVISNVINFIEFKAHEKNLEIIVNYGTNIGKNFNGDSLRIGQILTNLLGNAVKFTSDGEIGIHIKKVSHDKFRFEVTDTGIGLTKNEQSKLFQSFSQADGSTTRKYGGTGLGLTISKQLVELMGGQIWIESQKGVGSKFIFEINLEEKENKKIFNLFSNKKVLVVDDNKSWHEILKNTLEMFELEVEHAFSGKEAIKIISKCKNEYDLIIIDWDMPELNGIETINKINNETIACAKSGTSVAQLPTIIIMVSSFKQESIVSLANNAGINLFLQKPINPSFLNDMLCDIFLDDMDIKYSIIDNKITSKNDLDILKGKNILLVEDNTINQNIIIGLLENSGINIDIANNGKEAIEKVELTPAKYKLILMDIQMPIIDGYAATKIIQQLNKDIPIIALTANAMKKDIKKTKQYGMVEHLNKPIDIEKLYTALLKYMTVKVVNINEKEIEIPLFKNIDIEVGLSYLAKNKRLYLKILNDFYENNKNLKLENLNEIELERTVHTIKGLSANIGALGLNSVAKELEYTLNKELFGSFYDELQKVLDELKDVKNEKLNTNKSIISYENRDKLFLKLKKAVNTKQPKKCEIILKDIDNYKLLNKDEEFFNNIKVLINKYKFKDAIKLMESL